MKTRHSRKITGRDKKSPGLPFTLSECIRRKKAKEFGRLLREGAFDYPATNDGVELGQG